MRSFLIGVVVALALSTTVNIEAADKPERATYVGGGRYVGEDKSIGDAVIRQRSDEYSERERDRGNEERRYERAERRERDYDYRDSSNEY